MAEVVSQVREFNRFYTKVIGVLQPDLVGSRFTLTEARVLYEIAHTSDIAVADLRVRLGLDPGHLSRLLSAFEARALIEREVSTTDRRRQLVRLTEEGRAAFAELDAKQVAAIGDLLAELSPADREQLTAAMSVIQEKLGHRTGGTGLVLRAPEPGDLGWVVERHGERYCAEYGWGADFEAVVARIVADFADARDPRSAAWIAEIDGRRAGSVFCTPAAEGGTAQLRLLLVEPWARGAGVGSRLVDECLRFARRAGYRRIMLWTNDVLTAARRIYDRAGFTLERSEAHDHFGEDLIGEYWSQEL
ncbi:bifunctional helix-turn-helix transcriptional regulator/GNAT family N-acetyltransferase [Mycolicibacterium litorale]|uniref:MarR family transcriptional regulator n=1 Tax=Mycolicibacterium litorale TaxID=758802 RepID=A0AAD1INH5_9MYCO|nr:bifunctional helix-turn-helix transcriptional regulator/GNAT family N-acetyltransferase [Mycolicibacterium litorale]MCV7417118.1 bifunctional helix-turn-helix transcriptional regulator/GNAT family N-acetyltransferase [Mycolicibacterium litorale]TDY04906.1 MarR family transcriptional regulator with acetyltransferase activity [Mycolicibacterium litorale]BBY18334.1 MarR family transcriptional regulator [Mycolicibacterium litorale]